jgi:hypothetical protein
MALEATLINQVAQTSTNQIARTPTNGIAERCVAALGFFGLTGSQHHLEGSPWI